MEKQPSVKVVEKDKVYAYVCLNETEVTENHVNDRESVSITMYEYDYNEIIEDIGVLDIDDIKPIQKNISIMKKQLKRLTKNVLQNLKQ